MINYHPIMGISIFIVCLILAYYLGRKILLQSFKSPKNKVQRFIGKNLKNNTRSEGDASSPDAPWLNKNK